MLRGQSIVSRSRGRFAPSWRLRPVLPFAAFVLLTFADVARSQTNDSPRVGRHFARESAFDAPDQRSAEDASDAKTPGDAVRVNADDIETTVLTADAKPAVNARVVAASAGADVLLTNGEFDRFSGYPFHWRTDAYGRFYTPASQKDAWLMVMHSAGYAVYKPATQAKHRNVVLDPWSRVEGRYRSSTLPATGVRLMILRHNAAQRLANGPRFLMTFEATTGAEGRFAFERVPAGDRKSVV